MDQANKTNCRCGFTLDRPLTPTQVKEDVVPCTSSKRGGHDRFLCPTWVKAVHYRSARTVPTGGSE